MVAPTGVNEESPHQPVNPETAQAGLVGEGLPEGGTAEAAAGLDPELMAAGRPGAAPVEAGLTEAVPTEAELAAAELAAAELAGLAETRESRDISPLGVAAIIVGVIVLVGVAVGVLAVATHGFHKKTVVTYRPAAVFKLRPGDCVNSAPDGLAVTVLSCGTPHDAEVFATFDLPASSWPGTRPLSEKPATAARAGSAVT